MKPLIDSMPERILSIRNLKTYFYTYAGVVKALNGINLDVHKSETLGIVGETGSGKSVTALSVLRLVDSPGRIIDGEVIFKGEDLLKKNEEEMNKIRGNKIGIVFQDPMTYLNPVYTVGEQIAEAVLLHQDLSVSSRGEGRQDGLRAVSQKEQAQAAMVRAVQVLELVSIPSPERVINQYPHELSGGMRQRVMIAMALSCNPELLICDEATTFLDVTTQAQIFKFLKEIQSRTGVSIVVITHSLGLVAETCDRVAVMYAGDVVEYARCVQLFANSLHPYTLGLLKAIPRLDQDSEELMVISGSVPNLINPPNGCRFHPRCPQAFGICLKEKPILTELEEDHYVACHMAQRILQGV